MMWIRLGRVRYNNITTKQQEAETDWTEMNELSEGIYVRFSR